MKTRALKGRIIGIAILMICVLLSSLVMTDIITDKKYSNTKDKIY